MPHSDDLPVATLHDYARIVWRWIWLVIAVIVVAAAASFLVAKIQTPMYTATTRLMFVQPADPSNPASVFSIDTSSMAIQLQSVVNVIDSPAVRARATTSLHGLPSRLKYTVSASVVAPSSSTGSSFPDLVDVSAETTSRTAAASIADAYAAAVIALRKEDEKARSRAAQTVIQDQLKLYVIPASKLTSSYAMLLQQLSNLQTAEAIATGDFSIIFPATAPYSPSSPRPMRSAALGSGVGLIIGVFLAFVVGRFDTRVRTHRQLTQILGLPVLGRVPRMHRQALKDNSLVSLTDPEGTVSEALRMLRSNLEWTGIDESMRTLLITSCLKGEGKTLTVCNLGVTLARAGKKVIVVDADLRDPRVHRVFNLPNAVGLTSIVLGKTDLKDALKVFKPLPAAAPVIGQWVPQTHVHPAVTSWQGSLLVLPSGPLPPDPGEVAASRRLSIIIQEIARSDVDYVLVDAPPILSVGDAAALATSVDGVLIVVNLDKARSETLIHGRELLDALPCRKLGAVVVGERIKHDEYYRYAKTQSQTG